MANGTIYGGLENEICTVFGQRESQTAQWVGRAAKWHRSQENYANIGDPGRMSAQMQCVCGQRPGNPGECSGDSVKMWELEEAELSCLFLKPQFHFWGLLSG